MKYIKLTQNKRTRVDDDIFASLGHLKWCTKDNGNIFYAMRFTARKDGHLHVDLHHCVIGRPLKGFVVDHIDGDGLNNQRYNLRIVSHKENLRNSHKHRTGHLFGAQRHPNGRWQSQVRIGGKLVHVGMFATAEEASKAAIDYTKCRA